MKPEDAIETGEPNDWIFVEGRDDNVTVFIYPEEYPTVGYVVRPVELRVDGDLWTHEADVLDGVVSLEEGEVLNLEDAAVSEIRVERDGPGAPETYLSIET